MSLDRSRTPGPAASGVDLLLLLTAAMWGTNFSVLKAGLADVPPLFFAAARFVVALAVMVPLGWAFRQSFRVERRDFWPIVGVGLLGNALYMLLFVYGAAHTSADNAALILATVPVWVAVMASLGGLERVGSRGWVGVTVSLAGISCIVAGGDRGVQLEFGGASVGGDLLILLATLAWSGYSVLVRPLVQRSSPVAVTVLATAAGTVPLVVVSLVWVPFDEVRDLSARGWWLLSVSAVIGIALPYIFWNLGIRQLGSARTSLYSYLVPCFALVVAWLWLGESLTLLQGAGGALALVGVTLARRGPSPAVVSARDERGSAGERRSPR